MSNGSTVPGVGSYVQYNVTTQSPLSALPAAAERTIGIVRQMFTAQGQCYLQVVWNPGSATPETALYTQDQLCSITQQQAADITTKMNQTGQLPQMQGTPGSNYTQPQIPSLALPGNLQNLSVTPTLTGTVQPPSQWGTPGQPLSKGVGYQ